MGSCPRDRINHLVIDRDADAFFIPGGGYHVAGVWIHRILDEAGVQVLVEDNIDILARMGLVRYGREVEVTGAVSDGMGALNKIKEHGPKSVLDVKKTS